MKRRETPEQLLQRFSKRTMELQGKLGELQKSYDEYMKVKEDLNRLKGAEEAICYLVKGTLPDDENHEGIR